MKFHLKSGCLTVSMGERLDSNNSRQAEKELFDFLQENPSEQVLLDAEELSYISSSGLRIIMRLFRSGRKNVTVINVSPEIYDIFSMTGFTNLIDVQRKLRILSIEDCPVIGEGAVGTVYRLDGDTVVKVYKGGEESLPIIRAESDKAHEAFVSGVPTAIPFDIVRVGDQYGTVFEMVDAQNCNDLVVDDPASLDELIPRYASFLKELHSTEPQQGRLPSARDIFLENLSDYSSCMSEDTCTRIKRLLESMPEDLHFIHGDIQLKNVMISSGEMMLIDMDKICTGNPAFEFASLFATYVAFNEDNPDDTLKFMGINKEDAFRIYHDTLTAYLGNPDEEEFEKAEQKIRTLGYLRFLTILMIECKDMHNPLKDLRVQHSVEHLEELSRQVDSLTI